MITALCIALPAARMHTYEHMMSRLTVHRALQVEYFIIAIFTLEYLVKLVTAPDTWRFFRSPIALLDLAAVLPFYIELVILGAGGSLSGTAAGTRVLRVLRLIHFIRIVQLGARLQYIHLVVKAIVNSVDVLAMLFVLFVLLQTFFATIIYFAENGNNPKFDSIPQLMYFAAQTMTGVGYGDLVPTSAAAKWITSLCIVSGVICLALPISALGANFSSLYNEFKAKKGAAARGEALPNMRKLLAAVDMHNMAITDVIEHIKQLQSKISSCCLRVQQLAPRAKLVADVSSSDNDAMVRVLELHDLFNTMLTVLLDAKNHMALLETLSEVGGAAHSNDLQKALATCFLGTQNLSGWSKNHAFMADQLLSVQGELAKIRAHVDVLRKVD